MLFIDASVLVAILVGENDTGALLERLEPHNGSLYVSPIVTMEASLALARRHAKAQGENAAVTPAILAKATKITHMAIHEMGAIILPIDEETGRLALEAAQHYGKIVNHPAQLNMGDCYSYACAKAHRMKIAYKGNDFSHTDMGW